MTMTYTYKCQCGYESAIHTDMKKVPINIKCKQCKAAITLDQAEEILELQEVSQ